MGRILHSQDNGISWDIFFPIDTISETANESPWFDYRDNLVIFYDAFKYKNGYRFVGRNKISKPLDIYWDSTSNSFTNINKIKTSAIYQNLNNVIYIQKHFVFYSIDSGRNFASIPFPDSLLKEENPAIMYINPVWKILPRNDNEFLLLKYAILNKNDLINNPQQDESELIFFNFNINNHTLSIKKILPLGNDNTFNICSLPNNKYLLYGNGTSNKIRILDSNINVALSKYLDFFPYHLYTKNDFLWLVSTQKDSLFMTLDAGKTWSYYYLNNDTLLYENKTKGFYKISSIHDDEFILVGPNRITLFSLNPPTQIVENKNKSSSLLIYPNPATDYIEVSGGDGAIKIYDLLGVCVLTHPMPLSREGEQSRIDVSALPAGVYFVRVGGQMYKFVKI